MFGMRQPQRPRAPHEWSSSWNTGRSRAPAECPRRRYWDQWCAWASPENSSNTSAGPKPGRRDIYEPCNKQYPQNAVPAQGSGFGNIVEYDESEVHQRPGARRRPLPSQEPERAYQAPDKYKAKNDQANQAEGKSHFEEPIMRLGWSPADAQPTFVMRPKRGVPVAQPRSFGDHRYENRPELGAPGQSDVTSEHRGCYREEPRSKIRC